MGFKRFWACASAAMLLAASGVSASELHVYLSQPGLDAPRTAAVPEGALPWPASYGAPYTMETFDTPIATLTSGSWAVGAYDAAGSARIKVADSYGGADTDFARNGGSPYLNVLGDPGVTITLPDPVRYVGFWWAAVSNGDAVELLDENDNLLMRLETVDLVSFMNAHATLTALDGVSVYDRERYRTNPFNNPAGDNSYYVYLNFALEDIPAASSGPLIKKIRFLKDPLQTSNQLEMDNVATAQTLPPDLPDSWVDTEVGKNIPNPPVTDDDAGSTVMNQPTGPLDLTGHDPYIPAGSVTTVDTASANGGTVAADPANPGQWIYTPPANFTGVDTFTYTVCLPPPNGALCSTSTVTITILAPFVGAVAATAVPALTPWGQLLLAGLLAGLGGFVARGMNKPRKALPRILN
jgi:hypothetical protein